MSDESSGNPPGQTPSPGDQTPPYYPGQGAQQPNWGNAYPPPQPPQSPPPPGYGQPYSNYQPQQAGPPKHSKATTSMVLGIIGLAGFFLCFVTIFLSPFAWYMGAKAVKEIDASPQPLGGRSEANAGKILGIIGTVLMILSLLAIVTFIVLLAANPQFWDDSYPY